MMNKPMCPVCNTDEFVNYELDSSSHAESKNEIFENKSFFCHKCHGGFSINTIYNDNDLSVKFRRIIYKN